MSSLGEIEIPNRVVAVGGVGGVGLVIVLIIGSALAPPKSGATVRVTPSISSTPIIETVADEVPAPRSSAAVDDGDKQVRSANTMCRYMKGTGLLSDNCDISYWNSAITIVVDMTPTNARNLCSPIKAANEKLHLEFVGAWKMRIKSPYSGNNTIAVCDL